MFLQKNNVIGPCDKIEWNTLRNLREDIKIMSQTNETGKYSSCINKEKALYKEMLVDLIKKAA